ncbi:MAG: spore coat protein [Clostridiales bacterium]|nr:spore coat protein [Clostridiales bacterium]
MHQQRDFTERELMNDLLLSEKQVSSAYNTGITETSCTELRKNLTTCLTGTQEMQYDVFDAMNKRGWYPTKQAPAPEVQAAKTKFKQEKNQIQ